MTDAASRLSTVLSDRYRIERQLGEGGMATVYLAEDLKHDRRVAIKVLRPELAAVIGAERFLAEIRTTANLQHPHILPLFDSGEAEGLLFYVMPFVEGEGLRDRMKREKQLPVEEALRITRAVASALDYAHRRGVIHRDVKPENVLMHDGQPLVADFGIALAVSQAGGGRLTETGLSLGTPYYMSPEQATADRDPGAQSDVYSLGCMLYEMLVGDPPHTGSSAQAVLAKILTERPRSVTELRHTVPLHVGAAVSKALERLPADRFDTAEAFARALGDPGFTHATTVGAAAIASGSRGDAGRGARRPWTTLLPWALTAATGGWALWTTLVTDPAPAPVTRVRLTAPAGQEYDRTSIPPVPGLALSPDGSQVVYVRGPAGVTPGESELWRRPLDALEGTPITGARGAAPAFSRDGRFLAFRNETALGVVPAEGGTPVWLSGASGSYAWGDDGAIYYYVESPAPQGGGLMRWVPGTAAAEEVATLERRAVVTDVLPGSRAFLLSTPSEVLVFDLATGEQRVLAAGKVAKYLSGGHIVYLRLEDNALLVQPFDVETLTTTGAARSTSANVLTFTRSLLGEYAVADDGTLLYAEAVGGDGDVPVWVDRGGRTEVVDWVEPGTFEGIAVSPDGARIVAGWSPVSTTLGLDIWVFDLRDRSRLPLTRQGTGARPQWHPRDGTVSYVGRTDTTRALMRIAADGSGTPTKIVSLPGNGPTDGWWTRDGKELLIRGMGVGGTRSIFRFVPGADDAPTPWLDRDFEETNPAPSPDGRWLVYTSNQSGRMEVYAQPYPDHGAVVPVSIDGGSSPVWSRDGEEVFFVGNDGYLWSARVSFDASSFRVVSRERLFELGDLRWDASRPVWDVAPDGRFLFTRPLTQARESALVLVRNWVQEVTGGDSR